MRFRYYYIFYNSKLYYIIMVITEQITQSVQFIIAEYGHWCIGRNITTESAYIISEKIGALTIPTSGWEYLVTKGFFDDDPDLKFIHEQRIE